jgi:hypothetical protein
MGQNNQHSRNEPTWMLGESARNSSASMFTILRASGGPQRFRRYGATPIRCSRFRVSTYSRSMSQGEPFPTRTPRNAPAKLPLRFAAFITLVTPRLLTFSCTDTDT